jgi:hypothetical protein
MGKFSAVLEVRELCFQGCQWMEGKDLLTGSCYFYIVVSTKNKNFEYKKWDY